MLGLGGTTCKTGSRNSLHLPRRAPPTHAGLRSVAQASRASSSAGLAPLPREASTFPRGWAQAQPPGSRWSSSLPSPSLPPGPSSRDGGALRMLWQPVSRGCCPGHPGGAAGKAAAGQRAVMGPARQAEEESGLGPCPSASDSSGRGAFSSVTHLRLLPPLPPPATARRVHRPDGPAAPRLQGSCPSALAALLCTHTGGCPEGGPAPPPRIGGQGQGALLGQDKALLTPRASGLEPRGCCTHVLALPVGTAVVIRGGGTALASKCSPGAGQFSPDPRGSTSRTPSVVDATLRLPQRRGEP